MPNIKSQKKRVITNLKAQENNSAKKTKVRNAIKKYEASIAAGDVAVAEKLLVETISVIDVAKNDGIYKDNTVARKISRLTKMLNDLKNPEAKNVKKEAKAQAIAAKNPIAKAAKN